MPFVVPPTTPTPEAITLDPTEENTGSPLTISTGSYGLLEHSYPAPPLSAQWAASVDTEGAQLASRKHDNREISLKIDCATSTALAAFQAKVAKLYREGGTCKRTFPNGWSIVYDVLTVANFDPSFDHAFDLGDLSTVPITLICKPYGRGAPVTLSDHTETTLPALTWQETAITGDVPALGRLLIDNDVATAQMRLWWGMRAKYASSASTAALFYQAESLGALAATGAVGTAGASGSGSNVLKNTALTTSMVAQLVMTTATVMKTHIGDYRMLVRALCPATNTGTVSASFQWQSAGQIRFTTNETVTYDPAWEGSWRLLDMGMVSLPKALRGDQVWDGQVLAKSTVAGDDIEFDAVFLIPAERSGLITGVDPTDSPAVYSSGTVEVRHDGVLAKLGSLDSWLGVPRYEGDYLLIPPGTADFIIKGTRGLETGADSAIDDISARLTITPRYLVVPDA